MKSIAPALATLLFLIPTDQRDNVVRISGVVRTGGDPIPGATVTAEGPRFSGTTVSDDNGSFLFERVQPGNYAISVSLVGFRSESRVVDVPASSVESLEFNLRPGVLIEVLWVVPPPPEAYERAVAIAHLRIERTAPPADCGSTNIVTAVHDASALSVLKGQLPARIQLMQETAGGCFERGQVVEGIETTYRIGAEYIIFLVGGPKVFGRLAGASLAFRVRGGVVETRGFNGAPASMMMHEFKRVVERLLQ